MASLKNKKNVPRPDKYTLYTITCLANDKTYIGVCTYYIQRKHKHYYDLRKGAHANSYMQKDYNDQGEDSFVFDIINMYDSKNEALRVEKYYTTHVFCNNKDICYNIIEGGDNVAAKMRKVYHDRLKNDTEYWNKISEIHSVRMTGVVFTEEHKANIRKAKLGTKASEETKKKLSQMRKGANGSKAKKVIDTATGKIYGCLKDAVPDFNIKYDTLRHQLSGRNINKTTLKWL